MVKAKAIIYILNVCRIIKSGRYVTTKNSPPPSPPSFFILYFFFHVLILFLPYYLNMFFGVLSLSLLLYFSHIIFFSLLPPSLPPHLLFMLVFAASLSSEGIRHPSCPKLSWNIGYFICELSMCQTGRQGGHFRLRVLSIAGVELQICRLVTIHKGYGRSQNR